MKSPVKFVDPIRDYLSGVLEELKKCTWPTRSELKSSTVVVVIAVIIIACFIGLSDNILSSLMKMIIR